MSEHIRNLIDAIEAGKSIEIEQNFEAAMAEKLSAAIDLRKEHIASGLLGGQPQENIEPEQKEPEVPDEDDSHGI